MSEQQSPRDLEKLLKKLEWTVIRRLDGLLHGDYRTLFRGFGLDLADLREYQYHDDVRHIDWNVTARLQTPYVREYNEDRDINAWFLLDLSPSIDFGSGEVRKRSVAADFVAVLARLLTRHGNRVGALFYGDRVDKVIPARNGRRHVLHLMSAMASRPRLERSGGTSPSHVRALKQMLTAMASDRVNADVRVEEVNRPVQLWSESRFTMLRLYESRGLIGEKYILTNVSNEPMVLAEQEFDREQGGVVGVSIESHNLRPGESTNVFVLRQRK